MKTAWGYFISFPQWTRILKRADQPLVSVAGTPLGIRSRSIHSFS